jgi:hypothetical protein
VGGRGGEGVLYKVVELAADTSRIACLLAAAVTLSGGVGAGDG